MNLWKDIPVGDNPPGVVNVVVEVISGTRDKYEYNSEWETFVLDRTLYSSVVFPVEYGFIPQTWYEDKDPLDIMVICNEPAEVGCIIKSRVIGVLIIEDERGEDPKILSVPISDPRFDDVKDINDINKHKLKEIQEFFETYKRLEPHKFVKFKAWENTKAAKVIILKAMNLYKKIK